MNAHSCIKLSVVRKTLPTGYRTDSEFKVAPTFGSLQARFQPKEAGFYLSDDDLEQLLKRFVDKHRRYLIAHCPDGDPYERVSYPPRIPRLLEYALDLLSMANSRRQKYLEPWQELQLIEQQRLDRVLNSTVCLINRKGEILEVPNRSRGSPAYKRKMRNLSGNLLDFVIDNNLDVIHLAFSARCPVGMSPLKHDDHFDGIINSLMSYIRYLLIDQYPEGVRPEPMYLWGKEPTVRGYTHIHLLLVGVSFIPVQKLARWWVKQGFGEEQGVDLERYTCDSLRQHNGRVNPALYALKNVLDYPLKGHSDLVWGGLQTLKRSRQWTISHTLRKALCLYLQETSERSEPVGLVKSPALNQSDGWRFYGINRKHDVRDWEILLYFPGKPPPEGAS